jgi:hypothetical protein
MGITQSLPKTAYLKIIDIWMIFTMMYPFAVVLLYTIKDLIQKKHPKHKGKL